MNHNSHEALCEFRQDYIFGSLQPNLRRSFLAHLKDCAECEEWVSASRSALDHLPMALADSPLRPAGRGELMAKLRQARKQRRQSAPMVLVTGCLQGEFLGSWGATEFQPRFYVGDSQKRKLLGADPMTGPLAQFLKNYNARMQGSERYRAVHVIDSHSPAHSQEQLAHFEFYGRHCVVGTPGYEIFPYVQETLSWATSVQVLIDSFVNDRVPEIFDSVTDNSDLRDTKIAFVGMFTNMNISAQIRQVAPLGADIAVSSALSAASVEGLQEPALESLSRNFRVEVLESVTDLERWLDLD